MILKPNWREYLSYQSQLSNLGTEEKNKMFNSMDDVTKKREIALEVLGLLEVGGIQASESYWGPRIQHRLDVDPSKYMDVIEECSSPESGCEVCAKGAVAIATFRLGGLDLEGMTDWGTARYSMRTYEAPFRKGFSMDESDEMEGLYESWTTFEKYPYQCHSDSMLANIQLSIIANGGLDITDTTDYLKNILLKA